MTGAEFVREFIAQFAAICTAFAVISLVAWLYRIPHER